VVDAVGIVRVGRPADSKVPLQQIVLQFGGGRRRGNEGDG
jgi:hypothetical protein